MPSILLGQNAEGHTALTVCTIGMDCQQRNGCSSFVEYPSTRYVVHDTRQTVATQQFRCKIIPATYIRWLRARNPSSSVGFRWLLCIRIANLSVMLLGRVIYLLAEQAPNRNDSFLSTPATHCPNRAIASP
ncbi:hypothetical protein PM082_021540 [Marasmius tenuissimus]|nr:hypothetical protein PM082_021540 [Marasmius tenuissimus]